MSFRALANSFVDALLNKFPVLGRTRYPLQCLRCRRGLHLVNAGLGQSIATADRIACKPSAKIRSGSYSLLCFLSPGWRRHPSERHVPQEINSLLKIGTVSGPFATPKAS